MFSPNKKRVEELEEVLSKKDMSIATLKQEINGYRQTIASFPGIKADYDQQMATLKKEHDAKMSELGVINESLKKSVACKVNAELATIGLTLDQLPREDHNLGKDTNPIEVMSNLTSLKGSDRTTYYRQNESKILHALETLSKS